MNPELFALFTQYGGLIINALNNSTPGYDVADYVSGLVGTSAHAAIVRHGEAAILQTMSAFPEIAMFGESRLQQFVDEFINCEKYLSESGGDAEEELPNGEPGHAARSGSKRARANV